MFPILIKRFFLSMAIFFIGTFLSCKPIQKQEISRLQQGGAPGFNNPESRFFIDSQKKIENLRLCQTQLADLSATRISLRHSFALQSYAQDLATVDNLLSEYLAEKEAESNRVTILLSSFNTQIAKINSAANDCQALMRELEQLQAAKRIKSDDLKFEEIKSERFFCTSEESENNSSNINFGDVCSLGAGSSILVDEHLMNDPIGTYCQANQSILSGSDSGGGVREWLSNRLGQGALRETQREQLYYLQQMRTIARMLAVSRAQIEYSLALQKVQSANISARSKAVADQLAAKKSAILDFRQCALAKAVERAKSSGQSRDIFGGSIFRDAGAYDIYPNISAEYDQMVRNIREQKYTLPANIGIEGGAGASEEVINSMKQLLYYSCGNIADTNDQTNGTWYESQFGKFDADSPNYVSSYQALLTQWEKNSRILAADQYIANMVVNSSDNIANTAFVDNLEYFDDASSKSNPDSENRSSLASGIIRLVPNQVCKDLSKSELYEKRSRNTPMIDIVGQMDGGDFLAMAVGMIPVPYVFDGLSIGIDVVAAQSRKQRACSKAELFHLTWMLETEGTPGKERALAQASKWSNMCADRMWEPYFVGAMSIGMSAMIPIAGRVMKPAVKSLFERSSITISRTLSREIAEKIISKSSTKIEDIFAKSIDNIFAGVNIKPERRAKIASALPILAKRLGYNLSDLNFTNRIRNQYLAVQTGMTEGFYRTLHRIAKEDPEGEKLVSEALASTARSADGTPKDRFRKFLEKLFGHEKAKEICLVCGIKI